jgi:hypothetical protein
LELGMPYWQTVMRRHFLFEGCPLWILGNWCSMIIHVYP